MPNKDQQSSMEKEHDHRFQRTEQWKPVYSWLESLDTIEVIKSNDVLDWLSANPEISDKLHSKHARHHLLHYIKICHAKILKRKGLIVRKIDQRKGSLHCNGPSLSSIPRESELYKAKQSEALLKYEILVGLEKQLIPLFGKHVN
ncbi:uncharacterized protein LOC111371313 isoform X2 [Olea europaea var. sylvestris]|uniref:Uncharacterized protein n=2 Tax=Olea europaea subsp. europaea TaxID=158383 RepID=A0A8S0V7Z3_OLEEU|nr:uncharacterized protein LOC111371313 isoform X2 [Olea europaea var. sylvestris]CAA3027673.1 Hypothetical predicted protein [Olea europaea subsp. europaea]